MGFHSAGRKGNFLNRVFERGDIVRVCLNPTAGRELQGDARPALVISHKAFNAVGMTLVAPISQGTDLARWAGFAVTLMGSGSATQGVILVNMLRSIDLQARGAKFVEKVSMAVVNEVVLRLMPVFE